MNTFTRPASFVAVVALIASLATPTAFAMGRSGAPTPAPKPAVTASAALQAQLETLRKEVAELKAQLDQAKHVASAQ